jgi:UDP-N-acetylmuramate dehydrogenase
VLGGGSNILFTQDFDGLVLKNEIKGIKCIDEDDKTVYVEVGAGENWHQFVLYCIDKQWCGVENLSLIPGTVGASPIQNIGAYGVEIKDVFYSLSALNIETSQIECFDIEQCQFGYRSSVFKTIYKGKYVILSVTFCLKKNPDLKIGYGDIQKILEKDPSAPTIKSVSDAVIAIRKSKLPDPAEIGNSGSFFKNPEVPTAVFADLKIKFPHIVGYQVSDRSTKIPAGWLIEQAGWKGRTIGNIGVHKNQALVLVNYGGGSGAAIYQLALDIQKDVQLKFGVLIEPEVNIL